MIKRRVGVVVPDSIPNTLQYTPVRVIVPCSRTNLCQCLK